MSKAEQLLRWWILNNVAPMPLEEAEARARAQKLAATFTLAAVQLGIDKRDPGLDPNWLYAQMLDAVEETRQNSDSEK